MKRLRYFYMFSMILIIFISGINIFSIKASATEENSEILEEFTENIETKNLNFDFYTEAEKIINGENNKDANFIFSSVINLLVSGIRENFHLLSKLAALCIISGILSAIAGDDVSNICFLICLILITAIAVSVLRETLATAETTIDNLLIFVQSLLPSVSVLAASSGGVASTAFHPSLFISMQIIIYACRHWFLPLTLFISVLSVINSMSPHFHITKLLETCRLFVKWGLGILMTVYVAFLGIHGFAQALQAGAVSKTVKYAICTFIPVVGSVLSESAESVLSGFFIIKNAVGITGILAVISISAGPLVNILATSVIFRLSASFCEPAADKRITKVISDLAGNVSLVFSILLMVCVMFIISIAMILMLTNSPITIR